MRFKSENDAMAARTLLRRLAARSKELHDDGGVKDSQQQLIAKFSLRSLFKNDTNASKSLLHRRILTVTFTDKTGYFHIQGPYEIQDEGQTQLMCWDAAMKTTKGAAEYVEEPSHTCFRAREGPSIDSQIAQVASDLATHARHQQVAQVALLLLAAPNEG